MCFYVCWLCKATGFLFPHVLMQECFCASSPQHTANTKHITHCHVEKLEIWYLVKSWVSKSVINFSAAISLGAYLKIHVSMYDSTFIFASLKWSLLLSTWLCLMYLSEFRLWIRVVWIIDFQFQILRLSESISK